MMTWSDDSERETADDAFFSRWAKELLRAEVSRGQFDQMWDRIKIKLADLKKVEQLLKDVFGADAEMVDEDSSHKPE